MSDRHAFHQTANPFLTAPVGRLFLSNALPMAVVMSMGGVLSVVDGIFVGRYVGPAALAAVGLAFPVVMLLTALATLVGGGMSSLLARALGAGDRHAAGAIFAGAHGLALAVATALIAAGLALGPAAIDRIAAGSAEVAGLARTYLLILLLGAPVQLALSLHADALRNEGRAGLIATLSVLVNLLNIAANWLAIVVLGLGIAGSALGTVAAQLLGLALLVAVRARDPRLLPLAALRRHDWRAGWRPTTTLGLPLCLGFVGMAFVAVTVMLALRAHAVPGYDAYIAGYGVATRILGLAYLPQMAIALATQTITGNNAGAGLHARARAGVRFALVAVFLWCLAVTLAAQVAGPSLGAAFSPDPEVAGAVATILRRMTLLYVVSGPILVLALHFQALGQPGRTAVLTLAKPWILAPALILGGGAALGLPGIWLAFPAADAVMLALATAIVLGARRAPAAPLLAEERA